MKKILLLSALLIGGAHGVQFSTNRNQNNLQKITHTNNGEKNIALKELVLNINKIKINTEYELVTNIIAAAADEQEEFEEILTNIISFYDDWMFMNLPPVDELPTLGQVLSFRLRAIPKPSSPYDEMVVLPVKLINKNEYDITEFIKVRDLGLIINIDRNIFIDKLIKLNNLKEIDIANFDIDSIDYSHAIISGKNKWSGTAEITYSSKINSNWFTEWDSGLLSVNSYSGWNESSENSNSSYLPAFGKYYFVNYFKNIKVYLYQYSYLGHNGVNADSYNTFSINISNKPGLITIFDNQYDNVNEEYSKATISTSWITQNMLSFNFFVEARTWAFWGNTFYAYAKSRLIVKSIEFTV